VAVIDCDLQDDPKIIPELYVKALAEGADAVVVDRGSWKDTGFRRFASRTMYKLIELLAGIRVENNIGNFGIYSRRLVDILLSYQEKEVFFPVMVTITGLPKITYTADRAERLSGRTSYSLKHLLNLAIAILIRFSDRPLKLSVIFGLAFSGFSALVSIFLIFAYVTGAFSVPGWTSLILSVWFLAGFILAVLGVHGFYIGRIFAEVQNRPRILVESRTDTKQTK
jgi:dolichol-phosphate mannosyltransferase